LFLDWRLYHENSGYKEKGGKTSGTPPNHDSGTELKFLNVNKQDLKSDEVYKAIANTTPDT
jgi:hypothetical protein